jgi:hypothetical protein
MSKYLVQVILHDADAATAYDGLNAAMGKKGFTRELPGKKASYHLPVGTYWSASEGNPNDVRLAAAAAAEGTGQDFGIVVIRADGWSVMRLKKVHVTPKL